jgi:hypothetical protein
MQPPTHAAATAANMRTCMSRGKGKFRQFNTPFKSAAHSALYAELQFAIVAQSAMKIKTK